MESKSIQRRLKHQKPSRPEKFKKLSPVKTKEIQEHCDSCWGAGYNQACDDWEKFLPDEEELVEIIYAEQRKWAVEPAGNVMPVTAIAKAIAKRLGNGDQSK